MVISITLLLYSALSNSPCHLRYGTRLLQSQAKVDFPKKIKKPAQNYAVPAMICSFVLLCVGKLPAECCNTLRLCICVGNVAAGDAEVVVAIIVLCALCTE